MEDLLQAQYNNQLANSAAELFDQRQREQVNNAALGVMQLGYQNQNQMGLASLGDPMSEYNNFNVGGQTFGYGDPMAEEKSNFVDKGFLSGFQNAPGLRGSLTRAGISTLGRAAGLGSIASSALGFAFAPIAGIASLFSGLGRSTSIAGYLQEKRNAKARADAAARGARKQNAIRSEELSRDAARVTNRDAARGNPGGGGGMSNAQAAANREAARGRY